MYSMFDNIRIFNIQLLKIYTDKCNQIFICPGKNICCKLDKTLHFLFDDLNITNWFSM